MLRERINARLEALGINAFEAARRGGFERAFLHDLLSGRKERIHPRNHAKIAEVLSCSVEYLRGETDDPRGIIHADPDAPFRLVHFGLPLHGVIEVGAFRKRREVKRDDLAPLAADPGFDETKQMAFELRVADAFQLSLKGGRAFLGAIDFIEYTTSCGSLRNGDLVVVESQSDSDPSLLETSCCEVLFSDKQIHLVACFSDGPRLRAPMSSARQIIAVVTRIVQTI
jgi:hypothetical protein